MVLLIEVLQYLQITLFIGRKISIHQIQIKKEIKAFKNVGWEFKENQFSCYSNISSMYLLNECAKALEYYMKRMTKLIFFKE